MLAKMVSEAYHSENCLIKDYLKLEMLERTLIIQRLEKFIKLILPFCQKKKLEVCQSVAGGTRSLGMLFS